MVRPVSLSEPAFSALRREKRPTESDSDVVLRLVREMQRARKDPLSFLEYHPKRVLSFAKHLRLIQEMDAADQIG